MTKYITLLVFGGLMAGLVAGCISSAGITMESYPRTVITVNSKMVGNRLSVTEYNAAKMDGQLLLQLSVQNISKRDCQFEYRAEWKTKDGVVIETPTTTWIPISLSAKEKKGLKMLAPSRDAEDFVFIVRFSRPSTRWN